MSTKQFRPRDLDIIPDPSGATRDASAEEIVGAGHWADLPEHHRRQLALELDEWVSHMYRTRARSEKAINRGDYRELAPVRRLISEWGQSLARMITHDRESFVSGKRRGNRPPWYAACKSFEADALAKIVLEAVITSLVGAGVRRNRYPTIPDVSLSIGRNVDVARRMALWLDKKPQLYRAYVDRLSASGATKKHSRKVMLHGFNQKVVPQLVDDEAKLELEAWDRHKAAKIGKGLLLLVLSSVGGRIKLATKQHENQKDAKWKSPANVLSLDDETRAWIAKGLRHGEIEGRRPRPMVCPPLPWTGRIGGGYLLGTLSSRNVMRRTSGEARRTWNLLKEGAAPLRVYAALNYLGRTPLRVNANVLRVAIQARDAGLTLRDLPVQSLPIPQPRKPANIESNEKARLEYRQACARVEEANLKAISKGLANEEALAEAELYADEPELYFPHSCDFRGRMYPMPTGLNAQGSDLRRALLVFAHGKPVSSEDASSGWLAIQVAKTFGQDKLPFKQRVQWVLDHEGLIRRIADDPLCNRQEWEREADSKSLWQCLAACCEWRNYLDHGDGFVSHLPVYVDGTSNGIQHFAAMARDTELARLVNLLPSDEPQDIYRVVAELAMTKVQRAAKGGEKQRFARMWLKALEGYPLRRLAKNTVMTKPYGGSFISILDNIRDVLRKEIDPHHLIISEEDEPKAAGFLGKCLKDALADQLTRPDAVLSWLQACVEAVHKWGLSGVKPGFEWQTPSGWPWGLMYGHEVTKHIASERAGVRLNTGYRDTSDTKVDIRRQKSAASPNFVHGLDAAALVFAINFLEDSTPVEAMIAIHDAVGALAADVPHVNAAVRAGFVELYDDHDPLGSFYRATVMQVRPEAAHLVPHPPALGDLDIRHVLGSPYFFS